MRAEKAGTAGCRQAFRNWPFKQGIFKGNLLADSLYNSYEDNRRNIPADQAAVAAGAGRYRSKDHGIPPAMNLKRFVAPEYISGFARRMASSI